MKLRSFNTLSFNSVLVGCLLSSACAQISPTMPAATKRVSWERVGQERLTQICNGTKLKHYNSGFYGCSIWNPQTDSCKVYTLDILKKQSNGEQYVLGHEMMHCFEGNFHQ
jgi:hypothetical protein